MEIIPGINISVDIITSLLVDVSMVLLCALSLIMIRQASLMNKVVNYYVGGSLKILVIGLALLCIFSTILVFLF